MAAAAAALCNTTNVAAGGQNCSLCLWEADVFKVLCVRFIFPIAHVCVCVCVNLLYLDEQLSERLKPTVFKDR